MDHNMFKHLEEFALESGETVKKSIRNFKEKAKAVLNSPEYPEEQVNNIDPSYEMKQLITQANQRTKKYSHTDVRTQKTELSTESSPKEVTVHSDKEGTKHYINTGSTVGTLINDQDE